MMWNLLSNHCSFEIHWSLNVFLAAIANVYWHETRTNCKYIPTKTQTPGYLVTSFDPKMLFWKWTAICGELLKRMQQLFGNPQCTMFVLSWKNKPIGHHCQSVINEKSKYFLIETKCGQPHIIMAEARSQSLSPPMRVRKIGFWT
jgi:hypothetical protein